LSVADVVIRQRGTSTPPPREEGRWCLTTEAHWVVDGSAAALDEISVAAGSYAERVGATLLLSFRNAVGDLKLPHLGPIRLVSGKWRDAHFDAMLRELSEVAAALPFSARSGSGLPYQRAHRADAPLPYHAFVYLRYILSPSAPHADQLEPALRRIVTHPHRRLVGHARSVAIDRARDVGARGLLRILETPWAWQRASSNHPLAVALSGHLPQRVEEDQRIFSSDTAENRFVLAFLESALGIVERTRRAAPGWAKGVLLERLTADCNRMRQALARIRGHALWSDVGPMVHFPASSTVLQRRHGYREVLRHFVRLRMVSRVPVDEQALFDLLAAKDIASLYEIWTFFAVVRVLEEQLGRPSLAEKPAARGPEVIVPWELRVEWPRCSLLYNARFSRSRKRRSTSVPLRPDIVLELKTGKNRGLHLFDAKFRLTPLGELDADETDDEAATYKRADIYKMHTYRDAIERAQSVWTLYPGSEFAYFPARSSAEGAHGVGAIPIRPGHTRELERVVSALLSGDALEMSP
jgi:predicted component of viral defense system (DUF524 family)